jgi:hypothetical protein
VSLLDGGRGALPTVTHHAAELVERVRDYRMPTERLGADIGKTGLFQSDVAGGTAIYDSELRKPDLLDSIVFVKVALQGYRVSAAHNQRQILLLVVTPFAEVVLGWCDGQRNQ